jgi:hypothetical protein
MANRGPASWQRKLRAPLLLAVVVLLLGACASAAEDKAEDKGASRLPHLEADGIGAVHFGTSRAKVVAALQEWLGPPNAKGSNTACGSGFSEVAWHDFVAEFRLGRFSGYRFVTGGYPLTTPGSPDDPVSATSTAPALSTARSITLGSTLKELHAAYPQLMRSGALKWTAQDGLIFVEAPHTRNPVSATARIAEIKIGSCGDF